MSNTGGELIIGIDAGTSVVKSIAFDLSGKQVAAASVPNRYETRADGAAVQDATSTWRDCASTIASLSDQIEGFADRVVALSVTGQGDGTWLMDNDGEPVGEAWLWLDARAAGITDEIRKSAADETRYAITGTGLAACQMGPQLALMNRETPELLDRASTAFHCKDWLYYQLTGERVIDPSEAIWTFGDFKTRTYDVDAFDALGLSNRRGLLPEICDGSKTTHGLSKAAASLTGLKEGTPVSIGYVDVVCTVMGAGIQGGANPASCTIVGSTGIHAKPNTPDNVALNDERTGYVMLLPIADTVMQMQTNMASTINIDWLLGVLQSAMGEFGYDVALPDMIDRIEGWLSGSKPGSLIYHPYISEAGERGPFVNAAARAGFTGLSSRHNFGDLLRGVVEGLGHASRDCYAAMGGAGKEVRVSGGAARSPSLRGIISAAINTPVRTCSREEAGATGVAMMAAVANGHYPDMRTCIDDWVQPYLGDLEQPDAELVGTYDRLFPSYVGVRHSMEPIWAALSGKGAAG